MGIELVAALVSGAASLLAGGVASSKLIQTLVRYAFGLREPTRQTYAERLGELTASLTRASREVDAVVIEPAEVAKDRAEAVRSLETDLATLEGREKELKETIDALERAPLAVAEHFAKLVAPGELKSARRDYLLFGAGVVVSTALGIIIQLFVR